MQNGFLNRALAFQLLLLAAAAASSAEETPSKAKLLDEVLPIMGGVKSEVLSKELSQILIKSDPRLASKPASEIEKLEKDLTASVNAPELDLKVRQLWNEMFTEDELKYMASLFKSDIGKKMQTAPDTIKRQVLDLVNQRIGQKYEQVTKLSYPPPATKKPEPGWLTRKIWELLPETRSCGGT